MKKDYCSYELSKLLEEKEFYDITLGKYVDCQNDPTLFHGMFYEPWNLEKGEICAPSLYQVQKWMRDKHRLHIIIMPNNDYGLDRTLYDFTLYHEVRGFESENRGFNYCSYEECLSYAITKALELI